ncbi:MAG: isoleucine--tRNA ligase [Planctomycetota bacterium]|nr:isoleucine--tRNA ligase [Planctomycetota bacterium]
MFEPRSRAYLTDPNAFEQAILSVWEQDDLLAQTAAARKDADPFVFYEGPPTANGRPGIHHVLARTLKDSVCRYQTMRGKRIERKAGWDTHGLPVELEVEKQLGISGKPDIEKYGLLPFNEKCQHSVFTYKEEWETLSKRIGYLLDYDHPYVTFHKDYIESVWFLLSRFAANDLLYLGSKVLPWCGRCGTGLSSHEVGQGYLDIDDPSVWINFPLIDAPGKLAGAALVAWTTTPWTLPSNMGVCVHPDFEYAIIEHDGGRYILLESKAQGVFGEDGWEVVGKVKGSELRGLSYTPLFDWEGGRVVHEGPNHHIVVVDDFVSDEDGTGMVHMAPYGADDFRIAQRDGLQAVLAFGDEARAVAEIAGVALGTFFRDANKAFVRDLKERGRLLRISQYRHSYPHCWRCETPLIYYPSPAWFLRTTAYKDQMVEGNKHICWAPAEIGEGRFGEWLENNIDWALSRDRFWGTPLPVWVNEDDPEDWICIESFKQLEHYAGDLGENFDPHRPVVDEITFPTPTPGKSGTMRRVPQVIDCWFDSGAMPLAQHHWPFENRERVTEQFPASFICEGLDQTRGWFYSLHAVATFLTTHDTSLWESGELWGQPLPRLKPGGAYESCMVNGLLLDKDGVKMSKRLGNIVKPADAIKEHGADAIRWGLLAGGAAHLSRRYDDKGIAEVRRRVLGTLSASYDFFALYARMENWRADDPCPDRSEREPIDRWVLSQVATAAAENAAAWESLQPANALRSLETFIVDELSNWYIRRSRRRFWGAEGEASQAAAFATLYEVLQATLRMAAPVIPFLTDALWKELTGSNESVHLQLFPDANHAEDLVAGAIDQPLSEAMDPILRASSLGRGIRERVQIRVRQPLAKMVVHIANEGKLGGSPRAYEAAIREELNVKQVEWVDGTPDFLQVKAKPNFPRLGKRAGKDMKALSAAIAQLDRATVFDLQGGGTVDVSVGDNVYTLEGDDISLQTESAAGMEASTDGFVTIGLVTELTPELEREGLAREILNRLQTQRKESGLEVQDRIAVRLRGSAEVQAAVEEHGPWIAEEVLAPQGLTWVTEIDADSNDAFRDWELPNNQKLSIAISKITLETA